MTYEYKKLMTNYVKKEDNKIEAMQYIVEWDAGSNFEEIKYWCNMHLSKHQVSLYDTIGSTLLSMENTNWLVLKGDLQLEGRIELMSDEDFENTYARSEEKN